MTTEDQIRFHNHHGPNIVLGENNSVAYRKASFAHAIVFSERPLLPYETFLLQVTQTELGWTGHFRIGLTHFNPHRFLPLPQVAFPDLLTLAPTWTFSELKQSAADLDLHHDDDELNYFLPTDVGTTIGLFFKPRDETFADLHVVINGVDRGCVANDLLYNAPLYVVIDVYGTTKKVEIVKFHEVLSLQTACKKVILQTIAQKAVGLLPLPEKLKEFLLYK